MKIKLFGKNLQDISDLLEKYGFHDSGSDTPELIVTYGGDGALLGAGGDVGGPQILQDLISLAREVGELFDHVGLSRNVDPGHHGHLGSHAGGKLCHVGVYGGQDVTPCHVCHGLCLDVDDLGVVLKQDLLAR